MKLLERLQHKSDADKTNGHGAGQDAPQPQPEHAEPRLQDPTPGELSRQDYIAIVKRSLKEIGDDHLPNIAAALAYYAFLAIPSVLMVVVGAFSLLANPSTVGDLVGKLGGIIPRQAQSLLKDSLTTLTNNKGTGVTVLIIGTLLALWSLTGAMQNVMWGLNVAYGRDDSRGFLRRRVTALSMVCFAALGFLLVFGLVILGPALSNWIGDASGQKRSFPGCGGPHSGRCCSPACWSRSLGSTTSGPTSTIPAGSSSPSAPSSASSSGSRCRASSRCT
jgi:hypothetical protein